MFPFARNDDRTHPRGMLGISLMVLATCSLWAQYLVAGRVRGQIELEGGTRLDHLSVELVSQNRPVEKAQVMSDGSFELQSVPAGQYEVRVTSLYGEVIKKEVVSLQGNGNPLVLRLPRLSGAQPVSGSGPVSLNQLLRSVPSKARKELELAQKAGDQGKLQDSVRHLERAIQIYPDYMEAYNNLGVAYIRLGDSEKAAAVFRKATELDSGAQLAHTNLALALLALNRYSEAETSGRRALQLNPLSLPAKYVLGWLAAARNECTLEALANLKEASEQYPKARLAAARVLACRGESSEAAGQLRTYLESPRAENRAMVESWLVKLQP